jgi:hypothetical protein
MTIEIKLNRKEKEFIRKKRKESRERETLQTPNHQEDHPPPAYRMNTINNTGVLTPEAK